MKRIKRLLSVLLITVLVFCCGCDGQLTQTVKNSDGLNVYFIDVGQADCALVTVNGSAMLIDGGNADDGAAVTRYLKKLNIQTLDYVVCTHAHEDHVGGLSKVIDSFGVNKILAPVKEYSSDCFNAFVASANKQCGITVVERGYGFSLNEAEISVLWPEDAASLDTNNTSIVMKLVYKGVSFLFTGDAEKESESVICAYGDDLSANVLKVGHHGSSTSTSYLFLRSVLPQFAVISCGANNSYGHPHSETLDILEQAEVALFRTDLEGTVRFYSDGAYITVYHGSEHTTVAAESRTAALDKASDSRASASYIGNKNSKKFHLPTCSSLPNEENRVYFSSRTEAVNDGYSPCGTCKP